MVYWKERRGAHLDRLMLCPFKGLLLKQKEKKQSFISIEQGTSTKVIFLNNFLDGLSLMKSGILFQKKHPIMLGKIT